MPWGDRKPGHMQICMKQRGYQYDAMRCMIYGMRADHVDEGNDKVISHKIIGLTDLLCILLI